MSEIDRLSAQEVKNAKPGEKPIKLSDALGMYLEIVPGGANSWRMKDRYAGKG